jgi:ribosomal protein S18 acetylase RimI-like enzyme
MGKGYSRRANSVQTFGAPAAPPEQAIAYCETLYRRNGLPVIFKMTEASEPQALDEMLATRGYNRDDGAEVQTRKLDAWDIGEDATVTIAEEWSEEWHAHLCRLNEFTAAQANALGAMLRLVLARTGYASIREGSDVLACGLGVAQAEFVGLYDIVVDPRARRRGLGTRLVRQLLRWGKENGARSAYLQVLSNNLPALELYAQLGFTHAYDYWYRAHA